MRRLCSSGRVSVGLRGAAPRGEATKTVAISATFALLDMSVSISFVDSIHNFIMTYDADFSESVYFSR